MDRLMMKRDEFARQIAEEGRQEGRREESRREEAGCVEVRLT